MIPKPVMLPREFNHNRQTDSRETLPPPITHVTKQPNSNPGIPTIVVGDLVTDTHKTKISVFSCFQRACSKWQPWEGVHFLTGSQSLGERLTSSSVFLTPSSCGSASAEGQSGSELLTWNPFPCLMPMRGSGSKGVWEAHIDFHLCSSTSAWFPGPQTIKPGRATDKHLACDTLISYSPLAYSQVDQGLPWAQIWPKN